MQRNTMRSHPTTLFVFIVILASTVLGCMNPLGPSSNAYLASLGLDQAAIAPTFHPWLTEYGAVMPQTTKSVLVTAVPAHPGAAVISGTGAHEIAIGMNTVTVAVRAQDGTTREYSIEIERELQYAIDRTFRARKATDLSWYDVPSTLRAIGRHALVYIENTLTVDDSIAQAIADEFDLKIYEMIRTSFGYESDVDDNGRVILLLLDIIDGFSGSGGYVAGYFDPTHLYATVTYEDSNMADMLFLDVSPGIPGDDFFYAITAHEMQHLVNYNNTVMVDDRQQDLWINEGLSSGAEYLYAEAHVAQRISYYNYDPGETIRYGNNFFVWDGYWEQNHGDILANYSTVYLFFQWLRLHADNGSGIYKDILHSIHRDFRSVVDAAALRLSTTLDSWETVIGTWFHANLLNAQTGLRGYKGEIATTKWQITNTNGESRPLSPGESLAVRSSDGQFTYADGSGADIRYHGIDTSTRMVDTEGPTYAGDLILVYNADSDYKSADQTAVLPAVTSADETVVTAASAGSGLPLVYPIGIHFEPGDVYSPETPREDRPAAGRPGFTTEGTE